MPKSGQRWNSEFLNRNQLLHRFRGVAAELSGGEQWPTLARYTELAEARRCAVAPELQPLLFLPPEPKRQRAPRTEPIDLCKLYDGRIATRAEVPCLPECFHDLFNVLVWSAFPRAKRALHARQYRALTEWVAPGSTRLPGRRTREQDALTVFDEGGSAVVLTHAAHAAWQHASDHGSQAVPLAGAACVLFGHALMEHVLHGLPTVRSSALVFVVDVEHDDVALLNWLDEQITRRLTDSSQFAAPGADAVVTIATDGALTLSRN